MSILVVGGAGYIGSHTALVLKERGYEPVIFDSLELGHRKAVQIVDVPFVHGDYGDLEAVNKAMRKYDIDAVFHFGAYASVGDSVADPARYYDASARGPRPRREALRLFVVGGDVRRAGNPAYP